MTATTTVNIDDLAQRYFAYIYRRDLNSDRYKAMSDAERQPLIHRGMESCRATMQDLLDVIETRNIDRLSKRMHRHNRFFLSVFRETTGIDLGKTDKLIRERLREYVGPENWDRFLTAARACRDAATAEREAAAAKRQRDAALGERTKWRVFHDDGRSEERVGTMREFIDWAIADGFVPFETRRGAFPTVTLAKQNGDGVLGPGYLLRKKLQCDYARERYAARSIIVATANAASPLPA